MFRPYPKFRGGYPAVVPENYRDELIRRLAAAGVSKKAIAEKIGLTQRSVQRIVPEGRQNVAENPIKSTSAAEELEDGRNIRDVDDVSHTEVAKMAAVTKAFVGLIRTEIVSLLLGCVNDLQPPTIPPKSKQTSSESCNRLHEKGRLSQGVLNVSRET